jgi:large subunit ribosomal protein L24
MKIKVGENVIVRKGKDKGKTGKVVRFIASTNRVLVEGVNLYKHHERARKQGAKGQIIEKAMPIAISNVSLIDPKKAGATRVGYKVEGGKKVRVAKKSGQTL